MGLLKCGPEGVRVGRTDTGRMGPARPNESAGRMRADSRSTQAVGTYVSRLVDTVEAYKLSVILQ
jgi:hypothetical protein